ncbi:DUF4430 domain-containing protein [Jeotgalibaca sp. A122]|uniref:DUF4430 domain-containing protein n=1 Tax=Jeotgalibaca sp. A122 TaxID=3457322 RepID=UPI003FCEEDD0
MKKWFLLLFAGATLTACGTKTEAVDSTVESADLSEVTINVSVEGELIEAGSVTAEVEPGEFLLDVMKEEFEVVDEDNFITTINGYEQDAEAGKYWLFDLNGEMAPVGAHELELSDGDVVDFDLAGLE